MFYYTLIILFIAIVLSAIAIVFAHKHPKIKPLFHVIFILVIIALGIFLLLRIKQPIDFDNEREHRENVTIQKLKEIRSAQEAYKSKYGKYTGSFDTLIAFVKADSFEISRLETVGVWAQDEMTQAEAIKKGILKRTVTKKSVRDSLFAADYNIDNLRYIPFTEKKEFVMKAGQVETGSQVKVKVFEAYALYDDLFNGMDRQSVINYKDARYKLTEFEGVKVGSITEANNNAGNWEK